MNQLTTTLNGHTIHMVEVPEKSSRFTISESNNMLWYQLYVMRGMHATRLPPGNWKPLGLASNIPEEMAAGLVEHHIVVTALVDQKGNRVLGVLYRNYISRSDKKTTATESLHSFVKSHHFNPETTVLLIKE